MPGGAAARKALAEVVQLKSGPVSCGRCEVSDPTFDPGRETLKQQALLRVDAFSCNYRDMGFIRSGIAAARPNAVVPFGSEFCARVLAIGEEVDHIQPGDRVYGAFVYPEPPAPNIPPGIASNECSKEYLIVPAAKLQVVPDDMTDVEAASFALNGLTVASILMRLDVPRRRRVLILSGRSNVSLFACRAAAALGAEVTVVTTSSGISDRLRELGAQRVVVVDDPAAGLFACDELRDLAEGTGGFDAVVDPFMDAYLHQVGDLMAVGGAYATCGAAKQNPEDGVAHELSLKWMQQHFYANLLIKNLTFLGNCLGTREALARLNELQRQGALAPIVDSVYTAGEEAAFLRRTYTDPERFGKVVYRFDADSTKVTT